MDQSVIDNLQARTDAKLRYAEVQLVDIERLPRRNGDDYERSHQEAFLFHLKGAVETFLAEVNCYYGCGLPSDGISPGKLREVLVKRTGSNAPELAELHKLENLEDSWLGHAATMRDHSTHRGGVPRVIHLGGALDGVTYLKNPETGAVIEADYPQVFRGWLSDAAGVIQRLRTSALAQLANRS